MIKNEIIFNTRMEIALKIIEESRSFASRDQDFIIRKLIKIIQDELNKPKG